MHAATLRSGAWRAEPVGFPPGSSRGLVALDRCAVQNQATYGTAATKFRKEEPAMSPRKRASPAEPPDSGWKRMAKTIGYALIGQAIRYGFERVREWWENN